MNLNFTDEELAFQQEVRQFLAEALDEELQTKLHNITTKEIYRLINETQSK